MLHDAGCPIALEPVLQDGFCRCRSRLEAAGKAMADYIHGDYAECAYCNLSHAHESDCLIGAWLAAGGKTKFSL